MNEEEIRKYDYKRIKQTLENTKMAYRYTNAPQLPFNYILDMDILINMVEEEKENRNSINELINDTLVENQALAIELKEVKDKIREKIKWYEGAITYNCNGLEDEYRFVMQELKELLEEVE